MSPIDTTHERGASNDYFGASKENPETEKQIDETIVKGMEDEIAVLNDRKALLKALKSGDSSEVQADTTKLVGAEKALVIETEQLAHLSNSTNLLGHQPPELLGPTVGVSSETGDALVAVSADLLSFNLMALIAAMGVLLNDQQKTLGAQENANVIAVGNQAADTDRQADNMASAGTTMMAFAVVSLVLSAAFVAYQLKGMITAAASADRDFGIGQPPPPPQDVPGNLEIEMAVRNPNPGADLVVEDDHGAVPDLKVGQGQEKGPVGNQADLQVQPQPKSSLNPNSGASPKPALTVNTKPTPAPTRNSQVWNDRYSQYYGHYQVLGSLGTAMSQSGNAFGNFFSMLDQSEGTKDSADATVAGANQQNTQSGFSSTLQDIQQIITLIDAIAQDILSDYHIVTGA